MPAGREGIAFPRFPFDLETRSEPSLAILYSTDNIGQNTTLAQLGYPGRMIFRLHDDHPRLRQVMMSCPANRYSGARTLADSPEASQTWRILATDPRFDWIELGGQGYTHSPDGDQNLHHHEFAADQTGCNLDHSRFASLEYCRQRFKLVRQAYGVAGIADELVTLMRFPGLAHTPAALQAAAEAGFLAILTAPAPDRPGQETWLPYPGGEIAAIPDSRLLSLFARSDALEEALNSGRVSPSELTRNADYLGAVMQGVAYADLVASTGGILNLTDQWSATFARIGGAAPRYEILHAVLGVIDKRRGSSVWYPSGKELALWLVLKRSATVSRRLKGGKLILRIEPPEGWRRAGGELQNASLIVTLPQGWKATGRVRIRDESQAWRDLGAARRWVEPRGLALTLPIRGRTQVSIERG